MSDKLFTQEEVNRIVQERLAQEKNKFNADQAKVLQEALSRAEGAEKQLEQYKIQVKEEQIVGHLENALYAGNCCAPKEIANVLKQYASLNENKEVVFNYGGKDMSLSDGVKGWLGANTWAVKANPQGGSGAPAGVGGSGGATSDAALRDAFGLNDRRI